MTIKGVAYDEKKTAGERLVLACSELPNAEEKVIGSGGTRCPWAPTHWATSSVWITP